MYQRDRLASLSLLVAASAAWLTVAYVMLNHDPQGRPAVLLFGALALGLAVALTAAPLLWLVSFARSRQIAYRGAWLSAARRATLLGLLVSMFVVLRGQDMLSMPLGLFLLAMVGLIEVTLSLRR